LEGVRAQCIDRELAEASDLGSPVVATLASRRCVRLNYRQQKSRHYAAEY
jgi:hypothetical protein